MPQPGNQIFHEKPPNQPSTYPHSQRQESGFPATLPLSLMICDIHDAFFMETSTHHPPKPVYKGRLLLKVAFSLPLITSISHLQHFASSLSENPSSPVHYSYVGALLMFPTWVPSSLEWDRDSNALFNFCVLFIVLIIQSVFNKHDSNSISAKG